LGTGRKKKKAHKRINQSINKKKSLPLPPSFSHIQAATAELCLLVMARY
jgi:hypothetical protein